MIQGTECGRYVGHFWVRFHFSFSPFYPVPYLSAVLVFSVREESVECETDCYVFLLFDLFVCVYLLTLYLYSKQNWRCGMNRKLS